MKSYAAFLRAVNVGGRVVKMDSLRSIFAALGFQDVRTLLASGNVIFASPAGRVSAMEQKLENVLQKELGYEVDVFIRSEPEVMVIGEFVPFSASKMKATVSMNIGFLKAPLTGIQLSSLRKLRSPIDDFCAQGREVYWSCLARQSESTFSNAVFEKTTGARITFRGVSTVIKVAASFKSFHGEQSKPKGGKKK